MVARFSLYKKKWGKGYTLHDNEQCAERESLEFEWVVGFVARNGNGRGGTNLARRSMRASRWAIENTEGGLVSDREGKE